MSVLTGAFQLPRAERLEERWKRLEGTANQEDGLFKKAAASLERLKTFSKGVENQNTGMFLQVYTQAVLDITYFEENKLVDEDFPEESSLEKVNDLLTMLSEPEKLVKEMENTQEEHVGLSSQLLECLHWRRGALLYMYCHTIRQNEQRILENTHILNKCLKDGLSYLLKMFVVQCPVELKDGVKFNDFNTARLLSQGAFSDTHVLAMMYAGEMCYWGMKYCQGEEKQEESGSDVDSMRNSTLDFRKVGEEMLQKYVSVCEGPLKSQGWSTKNANQILDFLRQSEN